ncbi:MAG: RNA polymerase sigma-70 factor [Prevotella sp.]|nr:RNA polymerase sigma-70 factor [Prevotella sp.]
MSAKEFEDTGLPSTSGDAQTFKSLFLHWQPKLQAFIHGFVKDEETAKDLCSDIFLKLWLRREEIPGVSNIGAFLFRMAKNAIYNHFEHCSVAERYASHILKQPLKVDNPEEQLFADQLQERINIIIENLPRQRQTVYKMSREQGFTNEEIAQRLNINRRTVENHITAALAAMRLKIHHQIIILAGII